MVIEWIKNGRIEKDFPQVSPDDANILLIEPDKTILVFSGSAHPMVVERPYMAIGSGSDYALAALYLGKTAREAIEVAIALDTSVGIGIDTLTL